MRTDTLASDGVEREGNGPPTAFRIWRAGANDTDHGPTIFSERSAQLIAEEQEQRGNRYSIDIDHLSLDKDAPLENHRAVGWHSLEVRNGELWAVDIEWSPEVAKGLTTEPPAWKYFSPAYDVNEEGEVISYLNTALTANPATHRVTALASRPGKAAVQAAKKKGSTMKWSDIKAALDGDDEDQKAAAYAAIQAAFPDDGDGDKDGDEKKSDDADKKSSKKASEDDADKKDAEEEPAKTDSEDDADKKDDADSEDSRKASKPVSLESRVRRIEEDAERKTLLASRPDLANDAGLLRKLASAPIETVRWSVRNLPKVAASKSAPAAKTDPRVHAKANAPEVTRASNEGDAPMGVSRRSSRADELDAKLGFAPPASVGATHTRNETSIRLMLPSQAREHVKNLDARRAAAMTGGK